MKRGTTQIDQVFRALGDPHRLQILDLLMQREQNAGELLQQVDVVQSTLSHHMKSLCESGLVTARKSGKWTYYSVDRAVVELAREFLRKYLQMQTEEPALTEQTDQESGKRQEAEEAVEPFKFESGSESDPEEPKKEDAKESAFAEAKTESGPESDPEEPKKENAKESVSAEAKTESGPESDPGEPMKKKGKEKKAFGKKNGEKKGLGKKKEKGKKGEKKKEKKNSKKGGDRKKEG